MYHETREKNTVTIRFPIFITLGKF